MTYETWSSLLLQERLPAAFIDLDAFDRNVSKARQIFRGKKQTLRLATKSLRVPGLIWRALDSGMPFRGLMCYSAEEAGFLSSRGFDDFLIAYPTLQHSDLSLLKEIHQQGKTVALVVDCIEHLQSLDRVFSGNAKRFRVVIDADMSLRGIGGILHLGVRRSPIRSLGDISEMIDEIQRLESLQFAGIMGYEAQVAGLGDRNPFKRFLNPLARIVRSLSVRKVRRFRNAISSLLKKRNITPEIFNGGGTGSLNYSLEEAELTEVTMGSGLFTPHLFDYFSNIRFEPSCYFALQVVRSSDPGIVTLQGGGYIASGEPGWDKVPKPWLPPGMELIATEGCGEVQTPVKLSRARSLPLGSVALFRHAKAGELMERFNEVILISQGKVVGREKTYRGQGQCFF